MKNSKKLLSFLATTSAAILMSISVLSITSCSKNRYLNDKRYEKYQLAQAAGYDGSYEEWLESIKGQDGKDGQNGTNGLDGQTPYIGENGNWFIGDIDTGIKAQGEAGEKGDKGDTGSQGEQGPAGQNGTNGLDGQTPYIGENGNWFIGDVDTGVSAQGPQGEQGIQGVAGKDGSTILTGYGYPLVSWGKDGDLYVNVSTWDYYVKEKGVWTKVGNIKGAPGKDGISIVSIEKTASDGLIDLYTITYSNGETTMFTVTNGQDGQQGIQGEAGKDGHTPIIFIGENGNWIIDGVDSGISAQGVQGEKGDKGDKGDTGAQGDKGDKGDTGDQGESGKSAYELYIEQYPGYTWGQAQWIKDMALGNLSVQISFNTNGGTPIDTMVFCKGEQVSIDFETTKERGDFSGWYLDELLTQEADYSFIAEESLTLHAKFIMEKVSIKFVSNDATYGYAEVEFGEKLILPDNPTNLGYSFSGWFDENDNEWNEANYVNSDDLVLYAKYDYDFEELPAVVINVENKQQITSKEEYLPSTVSIINTKEEWQLDNVSAGIRGRGNSSWTGPSGKQPYRIKFDKKQSVFGSEYKAKSWTLIANAVDKSLLRNYIAYELGERLDGIDFSSKHTLVDVYLNDEYRGVYLLCDQIQSGEGRVDIDESIAEDGNNGYLIERDARAPSEGDENIDYFSFNGQTYAIKTPDTEEEDYLQNSEVEINYIKSYLTECDNAIKTASWADVENLIDIDSFIDSYIVDELFANNDCGYASCYYYKDKDGKLFKGPLWDFDIGAGNVNYNMGNEDECLPTVSLWAKRVNYWYSLLLQRNEFVSLVSERLITKKDLFKDVFKLLECDNNSGLFLQFRNALNRNFDRWSTMGYYVWPEPVSVYSLTSVEEQIDYLHDWLTERFGYLYLTYTGEELIEAFRCVFDVDDGVEVILLYNTSDYSIAGTNSLIGYSRNSSTGEPLNNGDGQLNFEIVLKDGYKIDSIDISGNYKNLKTPSDTGKENTYRITKIASHLSINIITSVY